MRILPVRDRTDGPASRRPPIKGRGVPYDPPNRFETVHVEMDPGERDGERPRTEFLEDATRAIVARNNSPDLRFGASLNPYRGCEHGCVYCYARPTHEYLGFSSGLDFERKILVKRRAPQLLRQALQSPSWRPQVIAISGVTDAYQPVERRLLLTRGCLAVLRDFRNPVTIVTKNHLVTRDIDILAEMAEHRCVHVWVSVTTLRNDLQRVMEPRTSVPGRRLAAIRCLSEAGIPVGVFVAPLIPRAHRRRDARDPQVGGACGGASMRPRSCCSGCRDGGGRPLHRLAGNPLPRPQGEGAGADSGRSGAAS